MFIEEIVKNCKNTLNSVFYEEKQEKNIVFNENDILGFFFYEEQRRWVEWLNNSTNKTNMLLGARSYGKSEAITIYYAILEAVQNNKKVGILTKRYGRGAKILRKIRSSLQNIGVELDVANSNSIFFKNNKSKEANFTLITINQAIKGMHLDLIIGDDLVDETDEYSLVELENTIDFYKNVINITKKIVLIGQPVTESDLYAILKDSAGVNIFESFYGKIPELDKNINLEELRKIGIPERNIQRNYFGILISDKILQFADLKVGNFDITNGVACIDPSFSGTDKNGIAIGYKDYNTNTIFIKVFELDGDVFELKDKIINILKNNNVYKCFIESNDGGGVLRTFRNSQAEIFFKGFRETKNKELRILSRVGRFKNNLVLAGDVKNVINYNHKLKQNDDGIDAVASLINFLDGNLEQVKEL